MAIPWLVLLVSFVSLQTAQVAGIFSNEDYECVDSMKNACGTTGFVTLAGNSYKEFVVRITGGESLYTSCIYYPKCLEHVGNTDVEGCQLSNIDNEFLEHLSLQNLTEISQKIVETVCNNGAAKMCLGGIASLDFDLNIQLNSICPSWDVITECLSAFGYVQELIDCNANGFDVPSSQTDTLTALKEILRTQECYDQGANLRVAKSIGESCQTDRQCQLNDGNSFCGTSSRESRMCVCSYIDAKESYEQIDGETHVYPGVDPATGECAPNLSQLRDNLVWNITFGGVTEAQMDNTTVPGVTEDPVETNNTQSVVTEDPLDTNTTASAVDVEEGLQKAMSCYPAESPAFNRTICSSLEQLDSCIDNAIADFPEMIQTYVRQINSIRRQAVWTDCFYYKCWSPINDCFGVSFQNALHSGDYSKICELPNVQNCITSAQASCDAFHSSEDLGIARMYQSIYYLLCEQNDENEKNCLKSIIDQETCIGNSFFNPSFLQYDSFCSASVDVNACIQTQLESSTCQGTTLSVDVSSEIQMAYNLTCNIGCDLESSSCFEDFFPYGMSVSYIDSICIDRTDLEACFSTSTCTGSDVIDFYSDLLDGVCESTACREAEIKCYQNINKLAEATDDADDHFTIMCKLLNATETCLAAYETSCSDMITVRHRLDYYKEMCTVEDNCYREALVCISEADFASMVLPQGAVDVTQLTLCQDSETTITCLQAASDSCEANSDQSDSIQSIIYTIESLCSDSCATSKQEACAEGVGTYLERWWTDAVDFIDSGFCGALTSDTSCLQKITTKCTDKADVVLSKVVLNTILSALEVDCSLPVPPIPDDHDCVMQAAGCFSTFTQNSLAIVTSSDDFITVCNGWTEAETCIQGVLNTCASITMGAVLNATAERIKTAVSSICDPECSITNATECVIDVESSVETIENMYACSPFNFGLLGATCEGSRKRNTAINELSFGFSLSGKQSEIAAMWSLKHGGSQTPKGEYVQEAINLWFDDNVGMSIPIYGNAYDCPPLWPGFMSAAGPSDMSGSGSGSESESGSGLESESGSVSGSESGSGSVSTDIATTCVPEFEWGILCEKYQLTEQCVETQTEECGDTVTTQITNEYTKSYDIFSGLCQTTTCLWTKGVDCIQQAYNVYFGYETYTEDEKERACMSIGSLLSCVKTRFGTCSPYAKKIIRPNVKRMLKFVKRKCKKEFPDIPEEPDNPDDIPDPPFEPPTSPECGLPDVYSQAVLLIESVSTSLLEVEVDNSQICAEWTALNDVMINLNATSCNENVQAVLMVYQKISQEDRIRYCVQEPECMVTTAYECVWGLETYAYTVMNGLEVQPGNGDSEEVNSGDGEVVSEGFIYNPPPYELQFCEMARATMKCLNRELVRCDNETVALVKERVVEIEVEYKEWLLESRMKDVTCFDACSSSPCKNLGLCVLNDTIEAGFTCDCMEGFSGDFCEIALCQFDIAMECALEQFNATLLDIIGSSNGLTLQTSCSLLAEKKSCIIEATKDCPGGHKAAAEIISGRIFTDAEVVCETNIVEVDDCPNVADFLNCAGILTPFQMLFTPYMFNLDGFCEDYAQPLRTCLDTVDGCTQPKALITGFLDSFCPSITCNIGLSAECLDNLLLIITYEKEEEEPEPTEGSGVDPTQAPINEETEGPVDPATQAPVIEETEQPGEPATESPDKTQKTQKTQKSPKSGSSNSSRSKSRPSDHWKSLEWESSRKTPKSSRRHKKSRRSSRPRSRRSSSRSSKSSGSGSSNHSRRKRDIEDVVNGVLDNNGEFHFPQIRSRVRRETAEAYEYVAPEAELTPEEPGFCWKVDYYKRCVFEASLECETPAVNGSFAAEFQLIIEEHNVRERCHTGQCDENPCQNNAECIEPDDFSFGYYCKCLPGYSGPHCDQGGECDLVKAQVCMAHSEDLIAIYTSNDTVWDLAVCLDLQSTIACLTTHLMSCREDEIYYDAFAMRFTFLQYLQSRCIPIVTEINECELGIALCKQNCQDEENGYSCSCNDGYVLENDGFTCVPDIIDPCEGYDCEYYCFETENNTAQCGCPAGYELNDDGKTCKDIDECSDVNLNQCATNSTCENNPGSYSCVCIEGLIPSIDGRSCIAPPDPVLECVFRKEFECSSKMEFFVPENINILIPAIEFCQALAEVTECVGSIAAECNVGDREIGISIEFEKRLLTNQQLYCPAEDCDFYQARRCINDLYAEVELLEVNSNRDWCSLLGDDELEELDSIYDWSVDDIDDDHNMMCQEKYFCLYVEFTRQCVLETVADCKAEHKFVFMQALTVATANVPSRCSSYCADYKPCLNDGTCIDGAYDSFSCICAEGFTGDVCEEEVGCEISKVGECLETYNTMMPSVFLDKCNEKPNTCQFLTEALECLTAAVAKCDNGINVAHFNLYIVAITDLIAECNVKYPGGVNGTSIPDITEKGAVCCYCEGAECYSNECSREITCDEDEVCAATLKRSRGGVYIKEQGCKKNDRCIAGAKGCGCSLECQICCHGDYCNEIDASTYTYGSLRYDCPDYTTGNEDEPNVCDPEPEDCNVESITQCLYNFNYAVTYQITTGIGADYTEICGTYSETVECIERNSAACSADYKSSINGTVEYMKKIVQDNCASLVCMEAEATSCVATMIAKINEAINNVEDDTYPVSYYEFLCFEKFDTFNNCIMGNIAGCSDEFQSARMVDIDTVQLLLRTYGLCTFPCLEEPCQNGGTCVQENANNFTCECPSGYFGELCEIQSNLYIFGDENGDIKLDVETVGMTRSKVKFSQSLQFMNFAQDYIYVSQYGYISFTKDIILNKDEIEDKNSCKDIIAPLFGRFDSSCGGAVYFHEYTREMTDEQSMNVIRKCNEDVQKIESTFSTEMALIITWYNVYPEKCDFFSNEALYPGYQATTFQLVLATQGRKTYAIQNYQYLHVDDLLPYVWIGSTTRECHTQTITVTEYSEFVFELGNTGIGGRHVIPLFNESLPDPEPEDLCLDWIRTTVDLSKSEDLFLPCPCNLDEASADISFELDRYSSIFSGYLCYNSRRRQRVPSNNNNKIFARETCCYDVTNKALLSGGVNGGYLTVVSGSSTITDAEAHDLCCVQSNKFCGTFFLRRPQTTCEGYESNQQSLIWGDPHMYSLDGLEYRFNGHGEYVLIESHNFELHGRFSPWTMSDGTQVKATAITALAAQKQGQSKVQFNIASNGNEIQFLVAGEDQSEFMQSTDTEKRFGAMVVSKNSTSHLTVSFPEGWVIDVVGALHMLEMTIAVPKSASMRTKGLLGVYDGDETNDLLPRDSDIPLAADSSVKDIHYNFGQTWRILNDADSLFTYEDGKGVADHTDVSFLPHFVPPCTTDAQKFVANQVCENHLACYFDYCVTLNTTLAQRTKTRGTEFDENIETLFNTAPVLSGPTSVEAELGKEVSFILDVSDAEGDTVEIALVGSVKEYADFDPSTGHFRWTPQSYSQVIEISFVATDSHGSISAVHYVSVVMCSSCSSHGVCNFGDAEYLSSSTTYQLAACVCHVGFTGDHCEEEFDGCANNPCQGASCTDLSPADQVSRGVAYECGKCLDGLVNRDGICVDEDECYTGNHACGVNEVCVNSYKSYSCKCADNYNRVDGTCIDINECTTDDHGCSHLCDNYDGGYKCGCLEGYALEEDRKTCVEEDKVTITTTIGRHIVFKLAIKVDWIEALSDMDTAIAAIWSNKFTERLAAIFANFDGARFKTLSFFQSSLGAKVAVIFPDDQTSLETAQKANQFAAAVNGGINLGGTVYDIAVPAAIVLNGEDVPIQDPCTVFDEMDVCANEGTCEVRGSEGVCLCTENYSGETCNEFTYPDDKDDSIDILLIILPVVGLIALVILILLVYLVCKRKQDDKPRGKYRENIGNAEFVDTLGKETYKASPAYHRDWPTQADNAFKNTVYHSYDGPASPVNVPAQPAVRVVPLNMPEGEAGLRISYVSTDVES